MDRTGKYRPRTFILGHNGQDELILNHLFVVFEVLDPKFFGLKRNSLVYNFVEVSVHNLESSQTWMDFLNHRVGTISIQFSSFLLFSDTVETVRGCVSLKKYNSQGKAVEMTLNSMKENS